MRILRLAAVALVPVAVLPVKSISEASKPVTGSLKTTSNAIDPPVVGSVWPAD